VSFAYGVAEGGPDFPPRSAVIFFFSFSFLPPLGCVCPPAPISVDGVSAYLHVKFFRIFFCHFGTFLAVRISTLMNSVGPRTHGRGLSVRRGSLRSLAPPFRRQVVQDILSFKSADTGSFSTWRPSPEANFFGMFPIVCFSRGYWCPPIFPLMRLSSVLLGTLHFFFPFCGALRIAHRIFPPSTLMFRFCDFTAQVFCFSHLVFCGIFQFEDSKPHLAGVSFLFSVPPFARPATPSRIC